MAKNERTEKQQQNGIVLGDSGFPKMHEMFVP
jgi:hypothetical protein